MPLLLHTPIASAGEVARLVQDRAREGQRIEFKGDFWRPTRPGEDGRGRSAHQRERLSAAEEALKDVVAMANAEGGDVVIGEQEEAHGASGWYPYRYSPEDERQLRGWLNDFLAPREVANTVETHYLTVSEPQVRAAA